MIFVTLRLSESLRSILEDSNNPRPEEFQIRVAPGTTVRQILASQAISVLLVPMITRNNQKILPDTVLKTDTAITLYGPLAGG